MSRFQKRHFLYLMLCIGVALLDFTWINKANQTYAKDYLNESIALSAATYATCRIINGGVSSIQESSINISPWGIGLEYEAGQILDPINDATERLSDACVKSMALLGVQRLLLSAINTYTIIPFYGLLALLFVSLCFRKTTEMTYLLSRGAVLLLLIRLATPVMCYVGTQVNDAYFIPQMDAQQARLVTVKEIAMAEFEAEIPAVSLEDHEADGVLESISQFFIYFKNKLAEFSALTRHRAASLASAVVYLKTHFVDITESLVFLFVLVIEKIILHVFLIPLLLFGALYKIFGYLSGERFEKLVLQLKGA